MGKRQVFWVFWCKGSTEGPLAFCGPTVFLKQTLGDWLCPFDEVIGYEKKKFMSHSAGHKVITLKCLLTGMVERAMKIGFWFWLTIISITGGKSPRFRFLICRNEGESWKLALTLWSHNSWAICSYTVSPWLMPSGSTIMRSSQISNGQIPKFKNS